MSRCAALLGLLLVEALGAEPRLLKIPPGGDRWRTATAGPYDVVLDIRDLYQINAHWEISRAGNHGALTTTVSLPSDWVRPLRLRFFQADDYQAWGIDRSQAADWFAETGFVGHRFKQVLVDGRLVWEKDVADTGTGQYEEVDLSWVVRPGQSFELTFRVFDRVPSDEELEGDYFRIRSETFRPRDNPAWYEPATYKRFETRTYWGDVVLRDATVADPAVAAATAYDWLEGARPQGAWERGRRGTPAAGPIGLTLETDAPAPLPEKGYPVRSGVPFAQGMLPAGQPVALRDPGGAIVPLQTTVLSRWPDGSTRWLLLDFVAGPESDDGRYTLQWQDVEAGPPPPPPMHRRTAEGLVVDGGVLRFTVPEAPGPSLLADVALADGVVISKLLGTLEARAQDADEADPPGPSRRYLARRDRYVVEAAGPVRTTVRLHGHLVATGGDTLGAVIARASVWAGLPYLHLTYRVFNGSDRHRRLDLSQLALQGSGGGPPWLGLPEVRCLEADGGSRGPDGLLSRDGFGVGVRWFWQQFPKAIRPGGDRLDIDLYHPTDPGSVHNWFAAGEAKRHEILLTFAGEAGENRRALQAFQHPPRLFDAPWHRRSGGWGPAGGHGPAAFPELHQAMEKLGATLEGRSSWGNEYGVRNFGDSRYGDGWYNNYYDMAHTLLGEYLLGGSAAFYRQGEAMVLHLMDVDVVHDHAADEPLAGPAAPAMWAARPQLPSGPPRRRSTGAVRAFGSSRHHNLTPVVDYKGFSPKAYLGLYHLTGDLDALETALAIGDYVARSASGIGGRSSRAQAFPLAALMAVYEETFDERLLQAARRLFEDALSFGPRRGAYVEPMMSFEYMANGGGMVTHLTEGMMLYQAASGDRRAAAAIVALASSVLAENTGGPQSLPCYWERGPGGLRLLPEGRGDRGKPGVTHYSGNPLQKNWSPEYVHQVCQGFAYAYDLTGKARFLEAARGGYEEAARAGQVNVMYAYWAAPVLLFYLDAFADH